MSDFGDYKHVKTKKPHICVYCGRKIPAGKRAWNYKGQYQGDWQNWYSCEYCHDYVEPTCMDEEYINGDEFNEYIRDYN